MSDELKNCPFCGGKAYIHEHYTFGGYVPNDYPHNEPLGYAIGCSKYDCRGKRENTGFMYDTEDQAIAAWNARADDAQIAANDNLPAETDISAEGHARNDMEMVDSRERLEADVYRAAEEMDRFYCGEKFIDTRKIIGWLDRQAAITRDEVFEDGEFDCLTCDAKVELCGEIDSLTAERDELSNTVDKLIRRVDGLFCLNDLSDKRIKELEAEVEAQRKRANDAERGVLNKAWYVSRDRYEDDIAELKVDVKKWSDAANGQRLVAMEQADKVQELTAERDRLREELRIEREAVGACEGCDIVDELTAENIRLQADLDEKQHVCDTQRDSFLKLERENRELQDVCGELERTLENLRGD